MNPQHLVLVVGYINHSGGDKVVARFGLQEVSETETVVCDRSVLKAYESLREVLGVSDEAVYQKRRGIETRIA